MSAEAVSLVELIQAGGIVGTLVFMVVAFYRGDIIAKTTLDRILESYEEQITRLTDELIRKIKNS